MSADEAQAIHDQALRDDVEHDRVSCWCCCFDCDFDFQAVLDCPADTEESP